MHLFGTEVIGIPKNRSCHAGWKSMVYDYFALVMWFSLRKKAGSCKTFEMGGGDMMA